MPTRGSSSASSWELIENESGVFQNRNGNYGVTDIYIGFKNEILNTELYARIIDVNYLAYNFGRTFVQIYIRGTSNTTFSLLSNLRDGTWITTIASISKGYNSKTTYSNCKVGDPNTISKLFNCFRLYIDVKDAQEALVGYKTGYQDLVTGQIIMPGDIYYEINGYGPFMKDTIENPRFRNTFVDFTNDSACDLSAYVDSDSKIYNYVKYQAANISQQYGTQSATHQTNLAPVSNLANGLTIDTLNIMPRRLSFSSQSGSRRSSVQSSPMRTGARYNIWPDTLTDMNMVSSPSSSQSQLSLISEGDIHGPLGGRKQSKRRR